MPNWCAIRLTIRGPASDVTAFVSKAEGLEQHYAPNDYELERIQQGFREESRVRNSVLSFHQLVPIPNEIMAQVYDPAGYAAEHALWGCKWGACEPERLPQEKLCLVTYVFQTAWSAPYQLLLKVSADFPTLLFALSFGEESPSRGRATFCCGEQRVLAYDQGGAASSDSEGIRSDDELYEARMAWEDHYLSDHDVWAASIPVAV